MDEARLTKARQSAAQQLTRLTTARQLLTTAQQLVLTVGSGGRTTGTGGRDDGAGSGSSYTYSEPEEEEHANPDPAGDRGGRDGAGPPGGGGGRPPGDPEPPSGGGIHGTARLPKCCACNRQGPEMVHTDAINALHFMTRPGPGDGMLLGVCLRPRAGGAMPVPDRHGNMVQGCGHLTCRQCVVDGPAVGGGMSLMCRCCAAAQVETPAAAKSRGSTRTRIDPQTTGEGPAVCTALSLRTAAPRASREGPSVAPRGRGPRRGRRRTPSRGDDAADTTAGAGTTTVKTTVKTTERAAPEQKTGGANPGSGRTAGPTHGAAARPANGAGGTRPKPTKKSGWNVPCPAVAGLLAV